MFERIDELGFLSDCASAALVTHGGSVIWWPGGRFDGPSVFSAMLGPDAGHFTLAPGQAPTQTRRRYLPGTLVLETDHELPGGGVLRVTDALVLEPGARGHAIGRRSPGALVRVVEARGADAELVVDFVPRPEYGLVVPTLVREVEQVVLVGGSERLHLLDGGALELDGARALGRLMLRAGERRSFLLQRRGGIRGASPAPLDGQAVLSDTIAGWRSWSELHDHYDGPYRAEVLHSALVLQGLTHQRSGALVAAASAGLPEQPGAGANWDYRYAWLRDAALTAKALLTATCADEAQAFFGWMTRAAVSCRDAPYIQIVFGVEGERQLDERPLDHLPGFRDSRPVRIGNAAWRQRQLDVLGEVLDVAHALGDDLETGDSFTAGFLCELADRACESWQQPDRGAWERRDRDARHTSSAAMCWVALDRGVRLAERLGEQANPARWMAARDAVRAAVLTEGFDGDRGTFVGELGGRSLDASVLLLGLLGFLDGDDPRLTSTCAVLADRLDARGLLRRSDASDETAAFIPATFWLAGCQAMSGSLEAAHATFQRAQACANDLGLLSEMFDPISAEMLGNIPQALSHVALITAARLIGDAQRRAGSK